MVFRSIFHILRFSFYIMLCTGFAFFIQMNMDTKFHKIDDEFWYTTKTKHSIIKACTCFMGYILQYAGPSLLRNILEWLNTLTLEILWDTSADAKCRPSCPGLDVITLTHWGRDKMATVSQTTLSNAFSWMKMLEFRLKFHWSLFLRVQLTIFQHWFR